MHKTRISKASKLEETIFYKLKEEKI